MTLTLTHKPYTNSTLESKCVPNSRFNFYDWQILRCYALHAANSHETVTVIRDNLQDVQKNIITHVHLSPK